MIGLIEAKSTPDAPTERRWENPYPAILRILRNYYVPLIVLGIAGGVIGALEGRRLGKNLFRSEGLVRIPFIRERIDPQSGRKDVPPDLFEAFMQSQEAVVASRRVIELAMQDAAWNARRGRDSAESSSDFSEHLKVEHTARTDFLVISFDDPNPLTAAAAVQSTIVAFAREFDAQNAELLRRRGQPLEARRAELVSKIDSIKSRLAEAAGSAGPDGAGRLYEAAVQRVVTLETSLSDARIALAGADAQRGKFARSDEYADALAVRTLTLSALNEKAQAEMIALGRKRLEIDDGLARKSELDKQLQELDQRLEELRSELGPAARVSIVNAGEVPLAPFQSRQLSSTVRGGLIGGLAPGLALICLGFIATSYRFWGDAEADFPRNAPLLGVLPIIRIEPPDEERRSDAARSLHQIRVMLQECRSVSDKGGATYLLSSCSAGEGKTSLATALGLSFAASGSRTLLIDCDFIGQSLTRRFDLGSAAGLKEALDNGKLAPTCVGHAQGNLWMLPVGQCSPSDAGTMAGGRLEKILAQARQSFDIVLIDSGPILGSVEAMVVAPRVEGIVFVVSRHQRRALTDASVRKLRSVGGVLTGMVFNRADLKDFQRSAYYSPYSVPAEVRVQQRPRTAITARALPGMSGFELFGPLVAAVAASLPGDATAAGFARSI